MDDNSIMTFGKHKGKTLGEIPACYLLWVYENIADREELMDYIEDNMDVLEQDCDE